ncbi:MAG: phosphoribosylamine--glycine ligase [Clostridia bacterium]|nr:phosphoribosylamine--glycine ligase [Clostridia bacterium]
MTIVVVGGGGREHAIIKKLKENATVDTVYCLPGNGGIAFDAICVPEIKATDLEGVTAFAVEHQADLVVVAPDDPLAAGMVDALEAAGIRAFGPNAAAARIEASKVFSKNLMKKYRIPTARYEVFEDAAAAIAYIEEQNEFPTVIKADGLALGKGVLIPESLEEAKAAVREIMEDKKFGASGNRVVVEQFLRGPEVSVLAFTDGKTVKPMVSSMDHKRALDGDKGLNTGGMGTVAPNPYYTPAVAERCMEEIFLPTIRAMQAEGCPFKGCLYFGLMLTEKGPMVIEYNCRFGDPETQVVLPLMKSDLLAAMNATIDGTLAETEVTFSDGAATCVVLASGGYPEAYEKGIPMFGFNADGNVDGATVYHAGDARKDGQLVTAGGRVLGVTATADTLAEAVKAAYAATEQISFEGLHKRTDIGQRALQATV